MNIDLMPFINAGIPGIILLWFMFRLERILTRFDKSLQLMARATIRLLERHDTAICESCRTPFKQQSASDLSKALSHINGDD